jgi:hypothetical protein
MMLRNKARRSERLKEVALALDAGKSNRVIATDLDVDEATVRRDRKLLEEQERKVSELLKQKQTREARASLRQKIVLPKKPPSKPTRKLARQSSNLGQIDSIAQVWAMGQNLTLADFRVVIDGAAKTLFEWKESADAVSQLDKTPEELLTWSRPQETISEEEGGPARIHFCVDWLARWMALCFPAQEELQDRALSGILRTAEGR